MDFYLYSIEMDEKENNLSEEQLAELSFFELFLKISMVMSYEIGDELSRKYIPLQVIRLHHEL